MVAPFLQFAIVLLKLSFLPLHHLVDCVRYCGTAPLVNFCDNDVTSGLLADITMVTVTLAAEHGQTSLGYLVTS